MNDQYEWMKFYEAAVLETDPESLPRRIEAAQYAIGQRVIKLNVDDSERREIVRTLNALSLLKREWYRNPNSRSEGDLTTAFPAGPAQRTHLSLHPSHRELS